MTELEFETNSRSQGKRVKVCATKLNCGTKALQAVLKAKHDACDAFLHNYIAGTKCTASLNTVSEIATVYKRNLQEHYESLAKRALSYSKLDSDASSGEITRLATFLRNLKDRNIDLGITSVFSIKAFSPAEERHLAMFLVDAALIEDNRYSVIFIAYNKMDALDHTVWVQHRHKDDQIKAYLQYKLFRLLKEAANQRKKTGDTGTVSKTMLEDWDI